MYSRGLAARLRWSLQHFPIVALLGSRQAGKTTLALKHADASDKPCVYLDLERASHRARLADPELYLQQQQGKLVVLDEIQRQPELFPLLRSLVDERRRAGERSGQFLILGSASRDLLHQSTETLAGRVAYLELPTLNAREIGADDPEALQRLWLRGGYPDSLDAVNDAVSWAWRGDFISTYIERDIPQLAQSIPAERCRRLLTMLAHQQGAQFNASQLAQGLGVTSPTVSHYCDLFVDLYLARRLPPWSGNSRKRLVKAPRLYLRDSGLAHRLTRLPELDGLLGHPLCGPSWEGFVLENLLATLPEHWQASYYRSGAGAEIDLVLETGQEVLAIEIKRSLAPKISKGFRSGFADIGATRGYYVTAGEERWPLDDNVEAIGLLGMMEELSHRHDTLQI